MRCSPTCHEVARWPSVRAEATIHPMADAGDDEEEAVKGPTPQEILSFLAAAARRRRKLGVVAFLLVSFLGIAFSIVKPPSYVSDVTIAALTNGNAMRKAATGAENNNESLIKGAATQILNDENLVALLKDAEIVQRWDAERTPLFRLKDKIMERLVGKASPEDFERGLVGMLRPRLTVTTTGEDTINIRAEWPTRDGAYRIVTAAQARFMNTQKASAVSMVGEGVTILQTYVQQQGTEVAKALAELEELKRAKDEGRDVVSPDAGAVASADAGDAGGREAGAAQRVVVSRVAAPPPVPTVDPALKRSLDEKKQELSALEDDRHKRLTEAQAQLADLSGTLGPAHPQVVALQHKVESLSQPSPEAVALRSAAASLEIQISEAASDVSVASARRYLSSTTTTTAPLGDGTPAPPRHRDAEAAGLTIMTEQQDDPLTAAAKEKLAGEMRRYDELNVRLHQAQIEADVAEASFKYKFTVMSPAEKPKKAKPPPAFVFAIGGILAGLLLYFLLPAAADLASGRVMASWQLRKLGIEALGEIDYHS